MEREVKSVRMSILAELKETGEANLTRVITYDNEKRVEIPINRDGSVKWFDDTRLINNKNQHKEQAAVANLGCVKSAAAYL